MLYSSYSDEDFIDNYGDVDVVGKLLYKFNHVRISADGRRKKSLLL